MSDEIDEGVDGTARRAPATVTKAVGRRFGDAEIERILQAAVDLQERSRTAGHDPGRGLTLEELRQVAEEAGIDPRFVDLAVADVDSPVERRESALAGGPVNWRFHTEVEGEITDEDRSRILHAIRSVMGKKGDVADVYGRMEWSHDEGLGPTIVGVASRDGRTVIDLTASRSQEAAVYHGMGIPMGGLFGGAALAALLGLSGPAVLPVIGAMAGVSYGAARMLWKARSAWEERKLRRVVERISSAAQEVAVLPPAEGGGGR